MVGTPLVRRLRHREFASEGRRAPKSYRPRGGRAEVTADQRAFAAQATSVHGSDRLEQDVDIAVCRRQALGGAFRDRATDQKVVKALLDGQVDLRPHKTWTMPDTLTWKEDPFSQPNWKAQFHGLRWIDPLRRIAMSDSEHSARAGEEWVRITTSWMERCLFGESPEAWNDMTTGIRTIVLVVGFPLVPLELRPRYVTCVRIHLKHLANPRNHGRANHLLHQLQGFFVAARFLRDAEMENSAVEEALRLFADSYDEEGINAEGAIGYHDLNYQWWSQFLQRMELEGRYLPGVSDVLSRSRKAIVHAVRPDGMKEMIGDTAAKSPLFDDGSSTTRWIRSGGRKGAPPNELVAVFNAGYAFGRSGWGENAKGLVNETFYSLRFGPDNPMHGHLDTSSFTIFGRGRPWIVDPGPFAYGNTPMRRFMTSRLAHNTVVSVSDAEHVDTDARLLHHEHDNRRDVFLLEARPSPGVRVRRTLAYFRRGDFFVLVDEIRSPYGADELRQLWHCDAAVRASLNGMRAELSIGDAEAFIQWCGAKGISVVSGREKPAQGWVTAGYGHAVPAPVVEVKPEEGREVRLAAVFSFESPAEISEVAGDGSYEVRLDGVEYCVDLPRQLDQKP